MRQVLKSDINKFVKLFKKGYSTNRIGKETGFSAVSVNVYLKLKGYDLSRKSRHISKCKQVANAVLNYNTDRRKYGTCKPFAALAKENQMTLFTFNSWLKKAVASGLIKPADIKYAKHK